MAWDLTALRQPLLALRLNFSKAFFFFWNHESGSGIMPSSPALASASEVSFAVIDTGIKSEKRATLDSRHMLSDSKAG